MNIGLVLSGAMAKGAYQIGALKAISEQIPLNEIKYISCASIGTLNAYAYYTGQLDKGASLWRCICRDEPRVYLTKLLRSGLLLEHIKQICAANSTIDIPFFTSLFDLRHKAVVYKNLQDLPKETVEKYLCRSIALPIYCRAVSVDSSQYYDGGLIDNIPVYPLSSTPVDYIICVYFDDTYQKFENTALDDKIIKINFPDMGKVKESFVLRSDEVEKQIFYGYSHAKNVLCNVLQDHYTNTEAIHSAIKEANQQYKTSPFRISTDCVITNINRLTKKLTKRNLI